MSTTSVSNPVPAPLDPKELDLLDKIIQKTTEKKIHWNKDKSGYLAEVSAGSAGQSMKLEFATTQERSNWTKFTVQTREGTVLAVDNTLNIFFLQRIVGISNPVLGKAMALFALVTRLGEGSVERAINALDKL